MNETLTNLIELYYDIERWREGGGDVRDLTYVLETVERITPEHVEELRKACLLPLLRDN